MIESLCDGDVPPEISLQLKTYAEKGYRVIALAKKDLLSATYRKTQRMERSEVESDMQFLGLIVMENRIKTETVPVITQLQNACLRTIMITGKTNFTTFIYKYFLKTVVFLKTGNRFTEYKVFLKD